jgi:hypothetical protein
MLQRRCRHRSREPLEMLGIAVGTFETIQLLMSIAQQRPALWDTPMFGPIAVAITNLVALYPPLTPLWHEPTIKRRDKVSV